MKTQAFLFLIAGVLAVHTTILFFFVRGGSAPAENNIGTNGNIRTEPSASRSVSTPSPSPSAPISVPPPSDGRKTPYNLRLNYKYTVRGAIPGIPLSSSAKAGILVDLENGNVLWTKNPDTPVQIASMTKIMTILLAYEDTLQKRNGVTLDTMIPVSRKAEQVNESQVYLDPRETFSLRELLRAASIKSANDAAYLIAEFLGGGSDAPFVARMNDRARELGMVHTRFYNPHGLPGRSSKLDNVSSPVDMVTLARQTMQYPLLMEWAGTLAADFRKSGTKGYIAMRNHNNLLSGGRIPCEGVDGLKTGFIARSGFCVTATAKRGDRRMVAVVMGYSTWRERDTFTRDLINWGYKRAENPAAPVVQKAIPAKKVRRRK